MQKPQRFNQIEPCVTQIIGHLGKDIRLALPLGLGKPPELVNALYARAKADPSIRLTLLTALSLEKPVAKNKTHAAFLDPFKARVWGNCPNLDYAIDLSNNALPPNVEVKEFYFMPGSRIGNATAQRNYICANYTQAVHDLFYQGCNLIAQLVCKPGEGPSDLLSLSCNPDLTLDLVRLLRNSKRPHWVVGQINQELPYMGHDAQVPASLFDCLIDNPAHYSKLFSTPKMALSAQDHAIGLYASALVRDGGTLQVGIGTLGDALVHAVQLRHQHNTAYVQALQNLGVSPSALAWLHSVGGTAPFDKGLYAATEMLSDGLFQLYQSGVLKRKVYDFWALQVLVDNGRCNPEFLDADLFMHMASLGVRELRPEDFQVLQHHNVFPPQAYMNGVNLVMPDGECLLANLTERVVCKRLADYCQGRALANGVVVHGGFFLGSNAFYKGLRQLSASQRALFGMTSVHKVNQLDHNPELYKAQRTHARFINAGLKVTLSGAVVSDGLSNARVVSGVGGQYNFAAMARQLEGGHSILLIRAVRESQGKFASNVVFNYPHCTLPGHLRDIVITEYGIANLRSKTDGEVAKALLNVADSRFQGELLALAQKAGKIEANYQIPVEFQHNTPSTLRTRLANLQHKGLCPDYPFGTDFTPQEQVLVKALKKVERQVHTTPKWRLAAQALLFREIPDVAQPFLERMQLNHALTLEDKVTRMLLCQALVHLK